MNDKKYVVALDAGTTSCRAVLFDKGRRLIASETKEFKQFYPAAGYVEHDAEEIYRVQSQVLLDLLRNHAINLSHVAAIGITNQRETTVVWDRHTQKPVCNAIVWQCRRTEEICQQLKRDGWQQYIHEHTGLVIDAYFSATKIKWILNNVSGTRARAEKGDVVFGTIDTWLLYKFTDGRVFATDHTNASRTMLYDINALSWDETLLRAMDIPRSMLADVKNSGEVYGHCHIDGVDIPIAALCGDQQASLFGQGCFSPGDAKNTYGTGCFILEHIGSTMQLSKNGLITTLAASIDNQISYAMEGSVFIAGALIQWLRDELGLLTSSAQSEEMAKKVTDTGGVYIVPAFSGLGAPYWDMSARGIITGITRGTNKYHLIRAALEAIAYQVNDVLTSIEKDTRILLTQLKVDGGAGANTFLMQFQADISQISLVRAHTLEATALGAASLAGLTVGFYDFNELSSPTFAAGDVFHPEMDFSQRKTLLAGWHKAVSKAQELDEENR